MRYGEEIVALYRERARTLRTIAAGLANPDHAEMLNGIAEEYEELADHIRLRQ